MGEKTVRWEIKRIKETKEPERWTIEKNEWRKGEFWIRDIRFTEQISPYVESIQLKATKYAIWPLNRYPKDNKPIHVRKSPTEQITRINAAKIINDKIHFWEIIE